MISLVICQKIVSLSFYLAGAEALAKPYETQEQFPYIPSFATISSLFPATHPSLAETTGQQATRDACNF